MPEDVAKSQRAAGLMVNREMAEMWFEFLKLNDHYKQYCDDRRDGITASEAIVPSSLTTASMGKLYCDWGDIYSHDNFNSWFDETIGMADESYFAGEVPLRRGWHLFGSEKKAPEEMPFRQLDQCATSENPNKRYIEVDVSVSDVVLKKQFEVWLELVKIERVHQSMENSRNIARYQATAANTSAKRLKRVLEVHKMHDAGMTPTNIVQNFRRRELFGFSRVETESNIRQVQRDIANAPKIIKGTLKGIFPAA